MNNIEKVEELSKELAAQAQSPVIWVDRETNSLCVMGDGVTDVTADDLRAIGAELISAAAITAFIQQQQQQQSGAADVDDTV